MTDVDRPRRAAKYKRISDDREGRELGVTRQDEDLDKLAERRNLVFVAEYTDNDISASTKERKERPEYRRMLEDARAGQFEVIAAYTSGRLTRRPREHEDQIDLAREYGVTYEFVSSPSFDLNTSAGRRIARTMAAQDAGEAEDIQERVQREVVQRAELGAYHGGRLPPLGLKERWEVVEQKGRRRLRVVGLDLDDAYAKPMQDAARRLLEGETGYSIATEWNEAGFRTREGARWSFTTIRRALLAPGAIGKRALKTWTYGDPMYDTGWPEVIDRRTWDRLHDLLDDPRRLVPHIGRTDSGRFSSKRALGGGLTVCGNVRDDVACGHKMMAAVHKGVQRFGCMKSTGGCGLVSISYEPLERFVLDMLMVRLDSPEFRAALVPSQTDTADQERALRDELADLDGQRRRTADAYTDGLYTRAEAVEKRQEIDLRKAVVTAELDELMRAREPADLPTVAEARQRWEDSNVERRRLFLQQFIEAVVIKPLPKGQATYLRRRTGESEESHKQRLADLEREVLRRRVDIRWRR